MGSETEQDGKKKSNKKKRKIRTEKEACQTSEVVIQREVRYHLPWKWM